MPLFLDTRGRSTLGIGVCARCGIKMSLDDLMPDPNAPGLRCCRDDLDQLDPYRLPPRESDNLLLFYPRPDLDISGTGPSLLSIVPIFGITQVGPATTWQPNTPYALGSSITPQNVNSEAVQLPQIWFLCIAAGVSGATPPVWPVEPGVLVGNYTFLLEDDPSLLALLTDLGFYLLADGDGDGTVTWLSLGVYPV